MRRAPNHIVVLALAGLLGVAACETGIEPFEQDADRRFAIHGFLDSSVDTQFVRVQALRNTLRSPVEVLTDVTVRSTGDGVRDWQFRSGSDEAGNPAHVFWSVFRPAPGVRHEVQLMQDGSVVAQAGSLVPAVPDVVLEPAIGELSTIKRVTFMGVDPVLNAVAFWYQVDDPITGKAVRIDLPYPVSSAQRGDGWSFSVFLTIDRSEILRRLGVDPDDRSVPLRRMGARVEIRSAEWTADSADPGIAVGHGFFASVGRYDLEWVLPEEEVLRMGFVDGQGG